MTGQTDSIVLFGSLSRYTFFTLQNLLHKKLPVRGIVLAAYSPSTQPSSQQANQIYFSGKHELIELAGQHKIPVCYFSSNFKELKAFLQAHSADLFVLSCYPRKLPESISRIAHSRCINIHPSKLPMFRGPDPIFWQLRLGETDTGVTIHEVTETIDGGGILHFESVTYPEGARLDQVQSVLIDAAVAGLDTLIKSSPQKWISKPQAAHFSSWQGIPCEIDYTINREDTTARTAFNFVRAHSGFKKPILVTDGKKNYRVQDAVRYLETGTFQNIADNLDRVAVQFSDGVVEFTVEHSSNFQ